MAAIRGFRDLDVYQLAMRESAAIFGLSRGFPRDEVYSLTSQIRRSSRAVGAMVAEAWARRRYPLVFTNKLDEALGEATETQSWLDQALQCGYITNEQHMMLDKAWQHIGAMLNRMIERVDSFCGSKGK
jgi:four helix bundle protein